MVNGMWVHLLSVGAGKKSKKLHFNNRVLPVKKEIVRYIAHLKKEESVDKNIKKALLFLTGKERFIGRDKP